MASDKQKRKAAKKPRPAGVPFRHPDGDRRHRGGMTADQAARDKQARQAFAAGVPEDAPLPPRESRRTGRSPREAFTGIPEDLPDSPPPTA